MEKDTVLLNVNDYNKLRDFKKEVESGNTYMINHNEWGTSTVFIGTNEVLEEMDKQLKKAEKENYELKNPHTKQPSIEEFRNMSWWQFRKWKRK